MSSQISGTVEAVKEVAEAAGQFVETMSTGESTSAALKEAALTMEERKAKMEQLRAKMVRSLETQSLVYSHCDTLLVANIITGEPRLSDRGALESEDVCAGNSAAGEAAQACGNAALKGRCGGSWGGCGPGEELGVDNRGE